MPIDEHDPRLALVDRHAALEFQEDWPGALATMTPSGYYEIYPAGVRVTGERAITEMWQRLGRLPCFASAAVTSGTITAWAGRESIVHCALWSFNDAGADQRARLFAEFRFDGDLIASETLYVDEVCERFVESGLGDDFRALPGVTQI